MESRSGGQGLRDGTELEPSVGRMLLEEWDRVVESPSVEKASQQLGQGGAGGGRQHGRWKGGSVEGARGGGGRKEQKGGGGLRRMCRPFPFILRFSSADIIFTQPKNRPSWSLFSVSHMLMGLSPPVDPR